MKLLQNGLLKLTAVLVTTSIFSGLGHAEELTGRLKKIKSTSELVLGVRDASVPFSYFDDKQRYQGYSIDLCLVAAEAIKNKLGFKTLKVFNPQDPKPEKVPEGLLMVTMVPVTSSSRIPLIANGTADISCDSATNNLERQKQVSFSVTEFVAANRFLTKKSSNIKTLDDLRGKTVVSTAGTSPIKQISTLNTERKMGMTIQSANDHAAAFLALEGGRAVAFVMDDILLASFVANSKNPHEYVISSEALSVEPYALVLPRDDAPFKKVVDDSLIAVYKSPQITKIYNKWFMSPIPPKGLNLNVPLSPQLKAVFAHPTDSGNPADYAVVPEAQKEVLSK